MINQMDKIYLKASLTIIDASGRDAQRGLPGVSSLARRPQKYVHIGNTTLLELPCGAYELKSSKWATRAWTYQEGYFSARRLIFTPSQVLFLCNENYQEESICRLFREAGDTPRTRTTPEVFNNLIPGESPLPWKRDFLDQVREYKTRDLTFPKDSLNAFLGVLNSLTYQSRSLDDQILHVSWGLLAKMKWTNDDLSVYLNWYHESPAERQVGFPSWAWTSWSGPVKTRHEGIQLHKEAHGFPHPLPHLDWEISWDSKDGKAVTIWELADDAWSARHNDQLQVHQEPTYPSRLKITCLVVPVCFQAVPLTEAQTGQETVIRFVDEKRCVRVKRPHLPRGRVPVLQFWKGIHVTATAYMDRLVKTQDSVIGLIFWEQHYGAMVVVGCLLARKLNGGLYERIGVIPRLFEYSQEYSREYSRSEEGEYSFHYLPPGVFLDGTGSVLEEVWVSARQKLPFDTFGERRTIVLE